jgi:ribulose-5-phosphate 4-epimerase/fuculose-1-phosphate aldolase
MTEHQLREQMCLLAKSLFDRGLTGGRSGNISARTEDGGLLVSPTGSTFGSLNPAERSRLDVKGRLLDAIKKTR